jgi:DNA modification methylase
MSEESSPAAQELKARTLASGIEVWCPFDHLVSVGDLKPHPKNPNHHGPEQIELLAKNIRYFGWRRTISVSRLSGYIVAGHGRLMAAQKLGVTAVPVDYQDFGSETDEMAVLLADNRLAELSDMNDESLTALLKELDGQIDMDLTGFDASELEKLLPPEDIDEPPVPEPPDEAITQPGDIYILGNHRLMCGDSSLPEDLDRLLDGARIQLCNTDPPYNVKVEPRSNNAIAAGLSSFGESNTNPQNHHQSFDQARLGKREATHQKLRPKDRPLANDFVSDEDFDKMLRAWFANIARALDPGRSFYIWSGYANLANFPGPLKDCGLYYSQSICWDKMHPVLTRKDFMGAFELAFYGWKEGAAHQFFGPNNISDLWHVKKVPPQKMRHLTEKCVELAVRAITYSSKPGENVLDLFGGSGSTLVGAEQCGRKAFLMELDPLYCDVIVQRWINLGEGRAALRLRGDTREDVTEAFVSRQQVDAAAEA